MSVDTADLSQLNQMMAQQLAGAAPQAPAEPQPPAAPEGVGPAAAPPVEGAPPQSQATPVQQGVSPQVTTQQNDVPPGFNLEEMQAQLQQLQERDRLNEERLARYAQMEQTLAAEQRRQQAEQLRAQIEDDLKQTYARLIDAENDQAAMELLKGMLRRYVEPVQQQAAQQVRSYEQLYQQQLERYTQEVQTTLEQAFRPGLAREIAGQYGLPETFAQLLERVADPDQMPQVAAEFQKMIAQGQPAAAAQQAALQASAHRQANTFALGGAPGGPVPAVEMQPMAATSKESLGTLAQILGWAPNPPR